MKKINLILVLLVSILALNSCRDRGNLSMGAGLNDKTLAYIPEDASTVTAVNLQNIMDKMDFEAVKKMDFYADAKKEMQEKNPQFVYLMEDPQNSGIDLSRNMYMYSDVSEDNLPLMVSVVPLKDKGDFATMLEKAGKEEGIKIEKKDGYSIARMSNAMVVFNAEIAVFGGGSGQEDLETRLADILKNKPAKSITKNKQFRDNYKGGHDFYSYQSLEAADEMLVGQSEDVLEALGLTKEDLKGNNMVMYGDFKDGKIEAISEMHLNKRVKEVLGAVVKPKVVTDFSKYIPSENLIGAANVALNLKGLNTLANEQLGLAQGADFYLNSALGMSRNDLMKAFDGDVFVAAYGQNASPNPEMLVGLKISDQKLFDTIISKLKNKKVLKEISKGVYSVQLMGDMGYRISVNSGVALVGTSTAMAKVAEGNFKPISKSKLEDFSGSFGMFADMKMLETIYPQMPMSQFENFTASGNLDGSKSTINFKEKNENSLKLLMKFLDEMYKKSEKSGNDLEI
jgi:hypothetical protein